MKDLLQKPFYILEVSPQPDIYKCWPEFYSKETCIHLIEESWVAMSGNVCVPTRQMTTAYFGSIWNELLCHKTAAKSEI